MAWVEKDHNVHWVPTPCYVQGRQPAAQAAQSHIQPGLECLQGWGIHSLLGQPVPVCVESSLEDMLPYSPCWNSAVRFGSMFSAHESWPDHCRICPLPEEHQKMVLLAVIHGPEGCPFDALPPLIPMKCNNSQPPATCFCTAGVWYSLCYRLRVCANLLIHI